MRFPRAPKVEMMILSKTYDDDDGDDGDDDGNDDGNDDGDDDDNDAG